MPVAEDFLLVYLSNQNVPDGPLLVPLGCEWIWHCHRLNLKVRNSFLSGKLVHQPCMIAVFLKKLDVGFSGTTKQFENTFGIRYWKAGAMYYGNLPSPVISIPQIFGSEIDNGFGVGKAAKHLTILETAVIEAFVCLWIGAEEIMVFRQWRAVAFQVTSRRFDHRVGSSELQNYFGDNLY